MRGRANTNFWYTSPMPSRSAAANPIAIATTATRLKGGAGGPPWKTSTTPTARTALAEWPRKGV